MNTIKNISGHTWQTTDGRTGTFNSGAPAWAILNDEGLVLSKDGQSPSVWARKYTAEEIAPYAGDFPKHDFTIRLNEPHRR